MAKDSHAFEVALSWPHLRPASAHVTILHPPWFALLTASERLI